MLIVAGMVGIWVVEIWILGYSVEIRSGFDGDSVEIRGLGAWVLGILGTEDIGYWVLASVRHRGACIVGLASWMLAGGGVIFCLRQSIRDALVLKREGVKREDVRREDVKT